MCHRPSVSTGSWDLQPLVGQCSPACGCLELGVRHYKWTRDSVSLVELHSISDRSKFDGLHKGFCYLYLIYGGVTNYLRMWRFKPQTAAIFISGGQNPPSLTGHLWLGCSPPCYCGLGIY